LHLQAGQPCFWGSRQEEELPAPEFVASGISAALRSEETSRSQRAGHLLGRATSEGLLQLGPAEDDGAPGSSSSGGLLARQVSLASAPTLSSLPEDASTHFGEPQGEHPPRVPSLAEMVALADLRAEQRELEALQQIAAAWGGEGRQRRPRADLGAASDGGAEPVYMAERGACLPADGRASPPLHQAVRVLEKKVHGRSFVRSFSNNSGGSDGDVPTASFSSRSAPNVAASAMAHSSSACPSPSVLAHTRSCPTPSPAVVQAQLASQIDRVLGIRVHKVAPLEWQRPGSLANLQAWLSTSRHVSLMGDLLDPSQQGSSRPSLDLDASSSGRHLQQLLPSNVLASDLPNRVAAAAAAISASAPAPSAVPVLGRQSSLPVPSQPPTHFQLQLMRFSSSSSVGLQPSESQGTLQPALQRAQSAVSCGAMRLLELAELSISCNSAGEEHGLAGGSYDAVNALDDGASAATGSLRGRVAGGSSSGGATPWASGGGLAPSASMQSMSSTGSGTTRGGGISVLGRKLSWGTTMAGAHSMLAGLRGRGGSSQQLASLPAEAEPAAAVPVPARRTRGGQLLRPLSPTLAASPEAQLNSLLAQESLLNNSSIPEGAMLLMPSASAELDFDVLSRPYSDAPEPVVRGGRLKRHGSSAAISIASGTSSRAGSMADPSDVAGSPLQRFLSLQASLQSSGVSDATIRRSQDGSVGRARSSPTEGLHVPLGPAPPINTQRRQRRASLLELAASGDLALEGELGSGEHCVRGGLTALARSASRVGSFGSGVLTGSLGSPPGAMAHASSMEAAALAMGWRPPQGAGGAAGQQPATGEARQHVQREGLDGEATRCLDQQRASSLPGVQAHADQPETPVCHSNTSFTAWQVQEAPGHSSPSISSGSKPHLGLSQLLSPGGSNAEAGPRNGPPQPSRSHSFDSATTCVTINGEGLAAAGAAVGAVVGAAEPHCSLQLPASAGDAAAGRLPGPSMLKLSTGLMYSYPEGPLSPTSSHTGQMGPGNFWPGI
jgi:hypothetical protein